MPVSTNTAGVRWPERVGPPSTRPRMNSRSCGEIQRAMLHFDIDGVVPGAGHLHALGIRIHARSQARAVVIDRLAVFPQLDRLVDAARLVVQSTVEG